MQLPSIPELSELALEAIPTPPPTLSALLSGSLQTCSEAKLRKSLEARVSAINALAARLHIHSQLRRLDELPEAVQRELTQTEASAWALMCHTHLILGARDAACDAGLRLLEHFAELPSPYQIFATRLIRALVVRVSSDELFDEIEQAFETLHDRDRDSIARLILVQRGIAKARSQELPAAL